MYIERDQELAILHMLAGKANSLSPTMVRRLFELFRELEASDARALIITGDGKAFCAGLALPELIDLDRSVMRGFMDEFKHTMLRLFQLPIPVIAAIDGHAIAGGCVLANQCDVRIAADRPIKIGLNEVQLGIGMPAVVLESLRLFLPASSLVEVALQGGLFEPHDALALGLIDEVVEPDKLLARARERARALTKVPRAAHSHVKLGLRRPAIEAIERTHAELGEQWLDTWFSADAQAGLRAVVDRLRKVT
jgi:enoyl-CoA hydratase